MCLIHYIVGDFGPSIQRQAEPSIAPYENITPMATPTKSSGPIVSSAGSSPYSTPTTSTPSTPTKTRPTSVAAPASPVIAKKPKVDISVDTEQAMRDYVATLNDEQKVLYDKKYQENLANGMTHGEAFKTASLGVKMAKLSKPSVEQVEEVGNDIVPQRYQKINLSTSAPYSAYNSELKASDFKANRPTWSYNTNLKANDYEIEASAFIKFPEEFKDELVYPVYVSDSNDNVVFASYKLKDTVDFLKAIDNTKIPERYVKKSGDASKMEDKYLNNADDLRNLLTSYAKRKAPAYVKIGESRYSVYAKPTELKKIMEKRALLQNPKAKK